MSLACLLDTSQAGMWFGNVYRPFAAAPCIYIIVSPLSLYIADVDEGYMDL
jgi:hypothetical protein